jgi:hypothetical protein
MRRIWKLIAVAMVIWVLIMAWRAYEQREPRYLGHPISYWIEPWQHHGTESPEREAAAFAAMDERGVRWLARQLTWKPSRLKEGFARTLNRFGDFMSDRDHDSGRRGAAVRALTRLGTRAQAAIPELEALSQTTVELHRAELRSAAVGALVRIRQEPLQPYIERLRLATEPEWSHLAAILAAQETNAAAAVPVLIAGLTQTNRQVWAAPTVHALGRIRSQPELTIPALLQQLQRTNQVSPDYIFNAVAQFGPDAKAAWPELVACLTTTATNSFDRQALLHALRSIDAAAFAVTNWP